MVINLGSPRGNVFALSAKGFEIFLINKCIAHLNSSVLSDLDMVRFHKSH